MLDVSGVSAAIAPTGDFRNQREMHDRRGDKRKVVVDQMVPILRANGGTMGLKELAKVMGCPMAWVIRLCQSSPRTVILDKGLGNMVEKTTRKTVVHLHHHLMSSVSA